MFVYNYWHYLLLAVFLSAVIWLCWQCLKFLTLIGSWCIEQLCIIFIVLFQVLHAVMRGLYPGMVTASRFIYDFIRHLAVMAGFLFRCVLCFLVIFLLPLMGLRKTGWHMPLMVVGSLLVVGAVNIQAANVWKYDRIILAEAIIYAQVKHAPTIYAADKTMPRQIIGVAVPDQWRTYDDFYKESHKHVLSYYKVRAWLEKLLWDIVGWISLLVFIGYVYGAVYTGLVAITMTRHQTELSSKGQKKIWMSSRIYSAKLHFYSANKYRNYLIIMYSYFFYSAKPHFYSVKTWSVYRVATVEICEILNYIFGFLGGALSKDCQFSFVSVFHLGHR